MREPLGIHYRREVRKVSQEMCVEIQKQMTSNSRWLGSPPSFNHNLWIYYNGIPPQTVLFQLGFRSFLANHIFSVPIEAAISKEAKSPNVNLHFWL